MKIFFSLSEALKQGFQVYDRDTGDGILLRMQLSSGLFVLAVCRPKP